MNSNILSTVVYFEIDIYIKECLEEQQWCTGALQALTAIWQSGNPAILVNERIIIGFQNRV